MFFLYSVLKMKILQKMDKEYINLIICYIMMPKMNGYELTEALRSSMYKLPVLIITAKNQMEDIEKAFKAGTNDYMIKNDSWKFSNRA